MPNWNWDNVGDAIHAAIVQASGFSADQVVWKHQNVNSPPGDYITLSLGAFQTIGIDWVQTTYDAERIRGEEVELLVRGVREVPLEVECFTFDSFSSNKEASALAVCAKTITALTLPSVRRVLALQNVSPFDPGPVQWIPEVANTDFVGRAVCTVRCYMPAPTVTEYVGYIERVSGTITTNSAVDPTQDFDTNAAAGGTED